MSAAMVRAGRLRVTGKNDVEKTRLIAQLLKATGIKSADPRLRSKSDARIADAGSGCCCLLASAHATLSWKLARVGASILIATF
jgi:hypothetical protein